MSKRKQFCETSSVFHIGNIKNEAIVRDFLQKWKVEGRADGLVPMRVATFPFHLFKVLRCTAPARKKWCQVTRSAAPVAQNHLGKPEDLMLQNATPLNISDEHVSCTAPATPNPSLQMLFKCPTPAIVLDVLQTLTFCSLLAGCRIPCACLTKQRFNVQKWREHVVLAFWLRNVLRATTACTFSTSELPKVLWMWGAFSFFTCKCASRHSSVQFFIFHLPKWMAKDPLLERSYFSTLRSHKSLEKHSE